jgi:hypothetical protein
MVRLLILPAVFSDVQDLSAGIFLSSLVETLIATGIVTVGIGGFLFWITPTVMDETELEILEPRRIGELLEQARRNADQWWFRGGTGRFSRGVTIPELAHKARTENSSKTINLLLIDPTDSGLCEYYADYRNQARSGPKNQRWTAERVSREVLATITAAYSWSAEYPLRLQVGLRRTISLHRYDISTNYAIVTREDPREPALRCDAGSFFYKSFLEDYRLAMRQARELSSDVDGIPFEELAPDSLARFLKELNLAEPGIDLDLQEIIEKAKTTENPYG